MSDFRVEEIGLDADAAAQVTALVNRSFPDTPDIDDTRIRLNTAVAGDQPSFYVAAKTGNEIIGFNAFIAHRLWLAAQPVLAFQSCWTATSDQHRGKGIFQELINAGRVIAKARGAGFLFGFPNQNSRPIFVNKLGFRELPSVSWRTPLVPLLGALRLRTLALPSTGSDLFQDDASLIELKRRAHGEDLIQVRTGESLMWGVRRKMARLPLPVFDIGGIVLKEEGDLKRLFRNLGRAAGGCAAAQWVGVEGGAYVPLFSGTRTVDPPFIVDDLNFDTRALKFNFFSGIRDYY